MAKDRINIDGDTYERVSSNKKTTVHFILDNSASMGSVQDATIKSYNEYVEGLKRDKKNKYNFQLTMFADDVRTFDTQDIQSIKKLNRETYPANGMSTSLYDGVCKTLRKNNSKSGKHIVIILTDGEENSSREYKETDFRKWVKQLEKYGNWSFVYLGANQDSYAKAASFGFKTGNVSNFNVTTKGMSSVSSNLMMATSAYADSGAMNTANYFTPQQQEEMEDTK